jgi:hypothetical protein
LGFGPSWPEAASRDKEFQIIYSMSHLAMAEKPTGEMRNTIITNTIPLGVCSAMNMEKNKFNNLPEGVDKSENLWYTYIQSHIV